MKNVFPTWKDKNGGSCLTTIPRKSWVIFIRETTIIRMSMLRWIGIYLYIGDRVVSLPRTTCSIKMALSTMVLIKISEMPVDKWEISIEMLLPIMMGLESLFRMIRILRIKRGSVEKNSTSTLLTEKKIKRDIKNLVTKSF